MGRRKERRLAAKIAAGRRVKLDIFAEPSEEVAGNSINDESGGNIEQDHRAGVPSSPSSSGEKQQNPLLLLGQYSDDDEVDEEASKPPVHIADETNAPDDKVVENKDSVVFGTNGNGETSNPVGDVEHSSGAVEAQEANEAIENCISNITSQYSEIDPASQSVCVSGTLTAGELVGNWKVVLHEESSQYYYWNTVTGETSWVIPNEVALETGRVFGENVQAVNNGKVDYPIALDMHTHSDTEALTYEVSTANVYGVSDFVGQVYGIVDTTEGNGKDSSNVYQMNKSGEDHNQLGSEAELSERPMASREIVDIHSAQLVKYGQDLLLRLQALKRSEIHIQEHEAVVKEIEIRISDCEALSSYGSTLLSFWLHTEAQLKKLEAVISKGETFLIKQKTSREENCLLYGNGLPEGSETTENGETAGSAETNCEIDPVIRQIEPGNQVSESRGMMMEGLSYATVGKKLENEKVVEAVSTVSLPSNAQSNPDDMDMDVEMEVDEETVAGSSDASNLLTQNAAPIEQITQPLVGSVSLDDPDIPPPPDEEWIPPPPPDNELVPPPPPEDPPEDPPIPYPPYANYMPAPYPEQYGNMYSLPTYEYYTPVVSDVTTVSYYVQVNGVQGAESQLQYEPAVATSFSEVAADVNSVNPVVCYDYSSAISQVPSVTSSGLSGVYIESGPVSYPAITHALESSSSVAYASEAKSIYAAKVEQEPVVSCTSESDMVSTKPSFTGAGVQDKEDALANGNAGPTSIATTKSQPKATRAKKRTVAVAPTLRSNKKVASLVNKWKAAKEELYFEEVEEPEDAYEILEKKRQKEIEEWHARQIASGEARDNANFLPLGGDWRERVKRRRAEAKADQSKALREASESETKQPDIAELSKNLPPSWQAYWDEASKQVYYGNLITSETTWTRPTR